MPTQGAGFRIHSAPAGSAQRDLPSGFAEFLVLLHHTFKDRHRDLLEARRNALRASLQGHKPSHLSPSAINRDSWQIELPAWCQDQRNQMTGPADDAELVVKMLNSGAPGVMLDLEDSTVNEWEHQRLGVENILAALRGTLTYQDAKRDKIVGIQRSSVVIWIRPRGLHIHQAGIFDEPTPASLFDVAQIVYRINPAELKTPLCFYIPKSESADEALWWCDLFQAMAVARGWPKR